MKRTINRILTPLIIVLMAVVVSSCDKFDYDPHVDNRTVYQVAEFTFNDNNLDNVDCANYPHGYYELCETLRDYYVKYFNALHIIVWDNGKYEVSTLKEDVEPQKPKIKNGKRHLNYKRYVLDTDNYIGTIQLTEVTFDRYDCTVYDAEYKVIFSATIQLVLSWER